MDKFEKWHMEIHTKKIINLRSDLTDDDLEVLKKLGVDIKDGLFTEYEYEMLKLHIWRYDVYVEGRDDKEILERLIPLEKTGISRERYNELLDKIDSLECKYSKLYSKRDF